MTRQQHEDHQSSVFSDLSTLIFNLIRYPPTPISFSSDHHGPVSSSSRHLLHGLPPISPAGFASLMLGVSLSLMLCGSVTFFIGFMLMPWAVGLFVVLYVVGVVSTLSMLGSAICSHILPSPSSSSLPAKDVPAWKLL